MPRPFPAEFQARAIALVRAGKPLTTAAAELGISAGALHKWVRQDQIDRGERDGLKSPENAELTHTKKRIRQLEVEVEILRRAAHLLEEQSTPPKRIHPVIDDLVDAGHPVKTYCRLLGVSSLGYYRYKHRPISATSIRREYLLGLYQQDPRCGADAVVRDRRGRLRQCDDESFWSSTQIELLNRKKWRTRIELANAIFDYIEIFYNRQRRHSQLGCVSPIEHELRYEAPVPA